MRRQRQRRVRGVGLRVPVEQLAADPLELPADRQLGTVQVDVLPDEPEHLAPAQPEHEDQDVRRVERVRVRLRRLEERPRLSSLVHACACRLPDWAA